MLKRLAMASAKKVLLPGHRCKFIRSAWWLVACKLDINTRENFRKAYRSSCKASTNLKPRAKSTLPQSNGKAQTRQLSSGSGRSYKMPESTLVSAVHKLSLNDSAKARNGRGAQARPRFSSSGGGWTNSFKSEWDVARFVKSGAARRVVVCVGAGLSTGSGIPDFRTPGSGLYDNLQKYRIPYPEAIFDIDYFHQDPKPFFELAKELYPSGKYRPNYCHYFLRMLHDKEQLLRIYTQNIDGLERLAGVPANKLVEAHGTFSTATCTLCGQKHDGEEIKPAIFSDRVPKCKVKVCPGVVKPDIVFFGEDLPRRFYLYLKDMMVADLIIVMGTSLEVQPFAGIVDLVRYNVPRILFNMEAVGPFRRRRRAHDFVMTGDLTESVKLFVTNMGWAEQMDELIQQSEEHKQAWVSDEGKPSQSPGVSNPTKGANQSSQAPGASNIQPKRHMHMLNSAKSEGHRPKVFIRPQQKEISNVRHGLFPKLGSETRFRGYRKQQISSSEESSDSSDSSEEESR